MESSGRKSYFDQVQKTTNNFLQGKIEIKKAKRALRQIKDPLVLGKLAAECGYSQNRLIRQIFSDRIYDIAKEGSVAPIKIFFETALPDNPDLAKSQTAIMTEDIIAARDIYEYYQSTILKARRTLSKTLLQSTTNQT